MNQPTLNFNPAPKPGVLFEYNSQNYRLYSKLLDGPVTNSEIVDMKIYSYTRRISDLREKLKPFRLDIKAERVQRGLFVYELTGWQ